jgi:protein-L-isoaspartate(D-aspartate) O-methyltransferase
MMYKLQRLELVESLERKGITDESFLQAMREVAREKFIPSGVRHHSYRDIALPIGHGQTISQPYTIGIMTQALEVKKGNKVLEIGTGSGYQAALLEKMGAKVYTIERNFEIYNEAVRRFEKLNIRANCKNGDGTIGWEEFAPFDKIIVTAGSPGVPEKLKNQLAIGGKMVIPVGNKFTQTLQVLSKISDKKFDIEDIPDFAFVPLIGREGWKEQ